MRRRVGEDTAPPVRRRLLLLAPLLLAACTDFSVLPTRPAVEVRRFPLAPQRPGRPIAGEGRGGPVLLLRTLSAAPGLEGAGLRRLRPDGSMDVGFYEEWIAPPAQLAEAALRAWLQASGRFSAVVQPGSRAEAEFILEAQLTALEAVPQAREARAELAGVLLRQGPGGSRVAATLDVRGRAPLAEGAGVAEEAAAMEAALGVAFTRLEAGVAAAIRPGGAPAARATPAAAPARRAAPRR